MRAPIGRRRSVSQSASCHSVTDTVDDVELQQCVNGERFVHHFSLLLSSRGSVVKATDMHPVNLASTPAGTHMSH